ncbi:MAG: T9SS type A sorting domain-containing protein, partial [Bacteroidia bacterium]
QQTFGGINIDIGKCIRQTADKGYIITGYTNSFGAGGYDVYLIKLDSFYHTAWTKTYGGTDWDFGNCVEQTSDGDYIVCGETYSFGNGDEDYYIIKTDINGDTLWTKTYGGTNQDVAKSIIQTSDGGYIVTGTSKSLGEPNGDMFTIKMDSMGDSLWSNKYGTPLADYSNDILESMYGGYIIAGEVHSGAGNSDAAIIKISPAGVFDSILTLPGAQNDNFQSIAESAEGKISMVGKTTTYGDPGGNGDIVFYILKSDWTYYGLTTFGGLNMDIGYSVEPTIDNAFIICGTTDSFNNKLDDIYLIKTDSIYDDPTWTSIHDSIFLTSVENQSSAELIKFNIYPNPATDHLTIDLSSFNKETTIEFFDLLGKKCLSETIDANTNSSVTLSLTDLDAGIYFIKIADNKTSGTKKIIIEK